MTNGLKLMRCRSPILFRTNVGIAFIQIYRLRHDAQNHKAAFANQFEFVPAGSISEGVNVYVGTGLNDRRVLDYGVNAAAFVGLRGIFKFRHLQPDGPMTVEISNEYSHRLGYFKFDGLIMSCLRRSVRNADTGQPL